MLKTVSPGEFHSQAELLWPRILLLVNGDKVEDELRTGGYLCVSSVSEASQLVDFPSPLLLARLGSLSVEVAHLYCDGAMKKGFFTLERDGAVRASDYVLAFFGLGNEPDEAFALVLAQNLGLLAQKDVIRIGAGNSFLKKYLESRKR